MKLFSLRAIITLTTRQMLDPKSYKEMKELIDYMAGKSQYSLRHKTNAKCRMSIINQYPKLMDVEADELRDMIMSASQEEKWKVIDVWCKKMEKKFGKELKIEELPDKKPLPKW